MERRRIAVVAAGLSVPSSTRLLADQLTAAVVADLNRHGIEVRPEVFDLRDTAHDVVNNLLTGFPPDRLKHVLDTVAAADGLIAVTPIFNASASGLFKSFFDVVESAALAGKPVLIGATGGTVRHSLALEHAVRPMLTYLHAVVVPTSVFAAAEDFGAEGLRERVDRAAGELAALVAARPATEVVDPFTLTRSFEELL
jgi:FMN reductase